MLHPFSISTKSLLAAVTCTLLLALSACDKPELEGLDTLTIAQAGGAPMEPTMETIRIDRLQGTDSMLLTGRIVRHGSEWIDQIGACYNTHPDLAVEEDHTTLIDEWEHINLEELKIWVIWPDSITEDLYMQVYATNQTGIGYGEVRKAPRDMQVVTNAAAIGGGQVWVGGQTDGIAISERGIWYAPSSSIADKEARMVLAFNDGPDFQVNLGDLTPGVRYWAWAFARDEDGHGIYASPTSFVAP